MDYILHIDKYLDMIIQQFGMWKYGLLAVIIFAETGFVVTPFLPGDSLLFAAGTFAALGSFNLPILLIALAVPAILGDSANYSIGKFFGIKLFRNPNSRIFRKDYLDRTHRFYEKYGRKTIILARFVPIIRTFAPFVAGMSQMSYLSFFISNVTGGILWVILLVLSGYYFGNIPVVKNNYSLVILAIIIISVMPAVIEFWRHRREKL